MPVESRFNNLTYPRRWSPRTAVQQDYYEPSVFGSGMNLHQMPYAGAVIQGSGAPVARQTIHTRGAQERFGTPSHRNNYATVSLDIGDGNPISHAYRSGQNPHDDKGYHAERQAFRSVMN